MVGFLNRRRHLERLSELLLTSSTTANSLVVAFGEPGVGKSALLRQASSTVSSRYCYVYCDRGINSGGLPGGLPLPELLQRRLTALASENGFASFDRFCADKQWLTTFMRGTEAVGSVVAKSLLPDLAADFALETYQQLKSSLGNRNKKIPAPAIVNVDDQRLIYALTVLESTPAIVHVDHANNLEDAELEILLQLLDETQIILFLEYTSREPFSRASIPAKLTDRRALILPVERLEKEYADRLFASLPERFATALRAQFVHSGDLRPFDEALAIQSREKGILEIFDITEDNLVRTTVQALEDLDVEHRHLLLAISAHAGPVDRALLGEFVATSSVSTIFDCNVDIDSAIDRFEDRLLVISTSVDVMCQSRLNDVVEREPQLSTIKTGFRKLWRDFYRSVPNSHIFVSDEDRCRQLLHQCAELNDLVGIARTLEEVGTRGISSRNPRSIVAYLKNVIEKLKFTGEQNAIARIALSQCTFFYEAGWFDEALACLQLVEQRTRRYQFLLAELYCATDHQTRGIRLAESLLAQLGPLSDDLNAELCLRLIILHGLRNSNRLKESRDYYLAIVDDKRFTGLDGFSVLLRYADLCLYRDEDQEHCLEYLRLAACLSSERNQLSVYASVCMSLVQQLGYTESLDEVEALLSEVEFISQRLWLQQATLLANRAVLSMYRREIDPQAIEFLKQALVLSYDPLDRILIQTNMLAWYATAGQLEEASRIAISLYRSVAGTAIDTEIRRIALYNIEQLERNLGNLDNASRLFETWANLHSGIDETYWAFRRTQLQASPSSPTRYRMTYHPVYLANWHTGLVPFEAVSEQA